MEKTEGMKPLETEANTKATATRHPAEIEADRIRIQLHNERIKTDALSRRCIQLGAELDAYILANESRTEKDMFDTINGNCYHRRALKLDTRRNRAYEKRMAKAYEDACTKNALTLFVSLVGVLGSVIFGVAGLLNGAFAAAIAGVALIAFGWALNDCVYLLRRCE